MIWIISYLVVGVLTVAFAVISDMRGSELDINYFKDIIHSIILLIMCGYFAPLILIICVTVCELKGREKTHKFTKLCHKIANLGMNRE